MCCERTGAAETECFTIRLKERRLEEVRPLSVRDGEIADTDISLTNLGDAVISGAELMMDVHGFPDAANHIQEIKMGKKRGDPIWNPAVICPRL